MKKLLAIILCLSMLFALAACGGAEDVRGETTGGNSSTTESDDSFSFGQTSGTSYRNDFLGLGCMLDDGWVFYSDEQIKELNNLTGEYMDDEIADAVAKAEIIYDMYATNQEKYSSINVNLEKRNVLEIATVDSIKKMLANTITSLESTFTNMGYANPKFEVTEVEIDGEKFAAVKGSAEMQGLKLSQVTFCVKKSAYLASISIATFDEAYTNELLESFYLIDD